MNKTMKIAILLIVTIGIILIIFFGSKVIFAKDETENLNSKVRSEIEYLESELMNLLNEMNNIKFENYKISIKEVPEESASDDSESEGSSGESNGGSNSSSESSSSSSKEGESSGQSEEATQKITKEYTLEKSGVLTSEANIDWDTIKNRVEELYISNSTITLDLYKINMEQSNILGFNSELDNLTIAVKSEDKIKTLQSLSKLYEYLPKYIESLENDENYATILKTKSNIFYGYSLLDTDDWTAIDGYNKKAIEEFSNILKTVSFDNEKGTVINKSYIDLNELQNAINLKDKEIYLIKYKNLLEQLNNL